MDTAAMISVCRSAKVALRCACLSFPDSLQHHSALSPARTTQFYSSVAQRLCAKTPLLTLYLRGVKVSCDLIMSAQLVAHAAAPVIGNCNQDVRGFVKISGAPVCAESHGRLLGVGGSHTLISQAAECDSLQGCTHFQWDPDGSHHAQFASCGSVGHHMQKMPESGWCGVTGGTDNEEWRSTSYTGDSAACEAKCLAEPTCIGYWQHVAPSQYAGHCTMFSSSGDFSGAGFGALYDRSGRGHASSSSDFVLRAVANCECWTKQQQQSQASDRGYETYQKCSGLYSICTVLVEAFRSHAPRTQHCALPHSSTTAYQKGA